MPRHCFPRPLRLPPRALSAHSPAPEPSSAPFSTCRRNKFPASPAGRRLATHVLWGAVVAALLAILLWTSFRGRESARVLRSYLPPPAGEGFDFTGDASGPPVITPDGAAIAFCARSQKEPNTI